MQPAFQQGRQQIGGLECGVGWVTVRRSQPFRAGSRSQELNIAIGKATWQGSPNSADYCTNILVRPARTTP